MLKASEKEYEYLGKEVTDIRSCITRYIGYIIGSNGILFILIKYMYNTDVSVILDSGKVLSFNTLLLPLVGILVISSLFFIVDYKFASHNRHVGYMQLLSQEMRHIDNEDSFQPISETVNLQKGISKDCKKCEFEDIIMSWQYMMSRWNNRKKEKDYNSRGFNKLDFRFQLPGYTYDSLGVYNKIDNENVVQSFLKEIVWKNQNFPIKRLRTYIKYTAKSWQYPKYLYLLSVSQVIVIVLFIFNANELVEFSSWYWWLLPIIAIWVYYGYNNYRAMRGSRSSDYYCWAMFPYRVQLLNNYGIRPVYFSTSFVRYFKSARLIKFFKKIKENKALKEYLFQRLNGGFRMNYRKLNKQLFMYKDGNVIMNEEKYDKVINDLTRRLKEGVVVNKLEKDIIRAVVKLRETQNRDILAK